MAPGTSALALSCAFAVPVAGFVAPPGTAGQTPTPSLRSAAAFSSKGDANAWGLATIACSGIAVAGAVAASRRRSTTSMRAAPIAERPDLSRTSRAQEVQRPRMIINAMVNPKRPADKGDSFATVSKMYGVDVETGDELWDPLGFSKLYDLNYDFNNVIVYPHVQFLREAELKHGRVAMLAFVGMVTQQFFHIPGYPEDPDWYTAYETCMRDPVGIYGIGQIFGFLGLYEGMQLKNTIWCYMGRHEKEPGDYGWDPLKLSRRPGFDMKKKQLSEIKNGRLAMIGFASMMANHFIPGSVPLLEGSYAVSPNPSKNQTASMGFCGQTSEKRVGSAKTAARYTTQIILPQLQWIKSGVQASDLAPSELRAKILAGVDVLVGKDGNGKLFCVGNLCPHIGTPLSEGADVIGDVIVCPLHGSSWKVSNGELIDWCVSPPIIGPLTGFIVDRKNLAIFDIRESGLFGGGEIEVLIDTNAKKAYEADYWKGILDAQGKDDGSYY